MLAYKVHVHVHVFANQSPFIIIFRHKGVAEAGLRMCFTHVQACKWNFDFMNVLMQCKWQPVSNFWKTGQPSNQARHVTSNAIKGSHGHN